MARSSPGSTRDLWQFITGATRPQELIALQLNRYEYLLTNGLAYYKKPSSPSGELLEKELKSQLKSEQKEVVKKLSQFLCLDELITYEVYRSYLQHDYRGSQKELQAMLCEDRHMRALVLKTRDYYFSERLYLLRCIKHILTKWQHEGYKYQEVFFDFIEAINKDNVLIDNILTQYETVCSAVAPTWETAGNYMTEQQAVVWLKQNLREQTELLQIMIYYYKDFQHPLPKLEKLLKQFKDQAFGHHQINKHLLDETTEAATEGIGVLQVLVILEGMDLEFFYQCMLEEDFSNHHILSDEKVTQRMESQIKSLGDSMHHGPVLLAWSLLRHLAVGHENENLSRTLGNTALGLNIFRYLSAAMTMELFSDKTLSETSHCIVYGLLAIVLKTFEKDTLGDTEALYDICAKVLSQTCMAVDFWEKGLTEGIGPLFDVVSSYFPLQFKPLLQLSSALASANRNSAAKVSRHLQHLPYYTEWLDRNSSEDLEAINELVWQLTKHKMPYGTETLVIPANTKGLLLQAGDGIPVIQWENPYNGWQLMLCEVHSLNQQISHGAGLVSDESLSRVEDIAQLVHAIIKSNPDLAEQFAHIVEAFFTIIHRFSVVPSPPLGLLGTCMDVIALFAKQQPAEIWHLIQQTGMLPFWTENYTSVEEAVSGRGLNSGSFGSILAGSECPFGKYPVTLGILHLVDSLVMPLGKMQRARELSACLVFILRQVFPAYHKWRYSCLKDREDLGYKCLDIFHKILTLVDPAQNNRSEPSLRAVCVYGMLFSEAGRALLEVVATGTDTLEQLLAQQSSGSDGRGIDLIYLVRMSFSVLNRLLLLRPLDQPLSPVEQALFALPLHRSKHHLVAIIAQYIHHRHDPRLSALATMMLKRLAIVSPMSLLACLGQDAEPIRDAYLMRLQGQTEDPWLKVVILELLAISVETQPGLIEMFLKTKGQNKDQNSSGQTGTGTGKTKTLSNDFSCLQVLLDLIQEDRQGTYHCLPSLLRAATDFTHALWNGHRDTAMEALRKSPSFWKSLCAPLFRDLPIEHDKPSWSDEMKTIANVLRIIAMELYSNSTKVDKDLKSQLDKFSSQKRLLHWSEYIQTVLSGTYRHNSEELLQEDPVIQLLRAWNMFLVVVGTSKRETLGLTVEMKTTLLSHLLSGLQAQLADVSETFQVKACSILSSAYVTLMHSWAGSLKTMSDIVCRLELALSQTYASSEVLLPSIQLGLLGALTVATQHIRAAAKQDLSCLKSLCPVLCRLLERVTYQLPPPSKAHVNNKDVELHLKVLTACVTLLDELVQTIEDPVIWLPSIQEHTVLSVLLTSLQRYMQARQGLQYIQAVLLLFLSLSKYQKSAEALAVNGLTQSTCLVLTEIYTEKEATEQTAVTCRNQGVTVTLAGLYLLSVELYSSMLATLKYTFLSDALNFLGVHQNRIELCLSNVGISVGFEHQKEAEVTCDFLRHLAPYHKQWRMQLPQLLGTMVNYLCHISHSCISLLIRPLLLKHLLEKKPGSDVAQHAAPEWSMSPHLPLQHQTSTDEVEQPSEQLVQLQESLLKLIGLSLTSLRQFTPDLCEAMLDQSLDVSEYSPLLDLGFNTPSSEKEGPVNFGTFLACINFCVRMLSRSESRAASPNRSPLAAVLLSRNMLLFVLENTLYFLLSQTMRYLRDPKLHHREKQYLKRELAAELNSFLQGLQRYLRRGAPQSPGGSTMPSPQVGKTSSYATVAMSQEFPFYKLVSDFVKQILR